MAVSLCGSFLPTKRSLVAFTWTITTVLTMVAFIMALVMIIHVHTHYIRLERYYEQQWEYNQKYEQNNRGGREGEGEGEGGQHQGEDHQGGDNNGDSYYLDLASVSSASMTFVAVYTMLMALALSMYGSTAIVGFTSLRGVYIAPCFSTAGSSKLRVGMFGGAIILFANMLLVCAVILGEVRVEDWRDRREREESEPYEVERIATILAVTCMFLASLYSIFAILLFLYLGSEESDFDLNDESVVSKPLTSISNDPRRENFITMGDSS